MSNTVGLFFFEAQTGRMADKPPVHSIFYNYLLPNMMWIYVEEHVRKAKVGVGGLEYDSDFLDEIKWSDRGSK